jgi:uncharacterized protein (TIGR00251 family)
MAEETLLRLRVQPNATKTQFVAMMADGRIKVKIQAPPVEGKANKALIRFLQDILDIKESEIDIIRGDAGRDKVVQIRGMTEADVLGKIQEKFAG